MTGTPERYNFDIATEKVCQHYQSHPMNCFFVASMLVGFPPGSPYKQERAAFLRTESRFIKPEDDPEKRFWQAVYDCYCLSQLTYKMVCKELFYAVKRQVAKEDLLAQVGLLAASFCSDIEFFDLKQGQPRSAKIRKELTDIGRQSHDHMLHETMKRIEAWANAGPQLDSRSKFDIAKEINNRNKVETGATLMKTFRFLLGTVSYSSASNIEDFAIQLMYKDNNLRSVMNDLHGFRGEVFGPKIYDNNLGRALLLQYNQGGEAFWPVTSRYLAFLFYIDFKDLLTKYLVFNDDAHQVRGDASAYFIKQTGLPSTCGSTRYAMTNEDNAQLHILALKVHSWDSYKNLVKGLSNVRPSVDKTIKKKAGSS